MEKFSIVCANYRLQFVKKLIMGGNQSSRKITIENDDPTNVVQVSNDVVQRLKGADKYPDKPCEPEVNTSGQKSPGPGQVLGSPFITSHQLKQEIEKEIQKNDQHWEKRIKRLQEDSEKINQRMQSEYEKAHKEMESNYPKISADGTKTPCQDKKSEIVSCFKSNQSQPLLCAKQVLEFTDCITNTRKSDKSK